MAEVEHCCIYKGVSYCRFKDCWNMQNKHCSFSVRSLRITTRCMFQRKDGTCDNCDANRMAIEDKNATGS
jgi:hypothetical protein